MDPSEVRRRILDDHRALRDKLGEIEELAGVVARYAEAVRGLQSGSAELLETLQGHLDLEDAILAPALRESDSWGDQRADLLLAHHREQRGELGAALDDVREQKITPAELARRMMDLAAELRRDMAHEEEDYLDENLLRDDIIAINLESG